MIKVISKASQQQLDDLNVNSWPIWSKEPSTFPWHYSDEETCYFLEGDVTVTPEGGEPVTMGKGDLVTFAKGLSCTWEIRSEVRKHYTFA